MHLKCKCCLCDILVILWDMRVKDPGSAGHLHFPVWWGRSLSGSNTCADTKQRLEEEKSSLLFWLPLLPSLSISLLEMTPEAYPYRGPYMGSCTHPSAVTQMFFHQMPFFSLIFLNLVLLHCMYKTLCTLWFWLVFFLYYLHIYSAWLFGKGYYVCTQILRLVLNHVTSENRSV